MKVAIIMGSKSDLDTMQDTMDLLEQFGISYEASVVSAHRTPVEMVAFAQSARDKGFQIIIAGAGGAAHLPGMVASLTSLPVIGVPIQSKALSGMDSLLSIVQMPAGVPVACCAIGSAGAKNAAILAAEILSLQDEKVFKKLNEFRSKQTNDVLADRMIKTCE